MTKPAHSEKEMMVSELAKVLAIFQQKAILSVLHDSPIVCGWDLGSPDGDYSVYAKHNKDGSLTVIRTDEI